MQSCSGRNSLALFPALWQAPQCKRGGAAEQRQILPAALRCVFPAQTCALAHREALLACLLWGCVSKDEALAGPVASQDLEELPSLRASQQRSGRSGWVGEGEALSLDDQPSGWGVVNSRPSLSLHPHSPPTPRTLTRRRRRLFAFANLARLLWPWYCPANLQEKQQSFPPPPPASLCFQSLLRGTRFRGEVARETRRDVPFSSQASASKPWASACLLEPSEQGGYS